jgi:hypothetical protein
LLPQIRFEDFGCRQEPENGHVSLGEAAAYFLGEGREPIGQQPCPDGSCSSYRQSLAQKGTAIGRNFRWLHRMFHDILFPRLLRSVFHDLLLNVGKSI